MQTELNLSLVISNVFILPIVVLLITRRDFVDAYFFTCLTIFSTTYHLCADMNKCICDLYVLNYIDVLFATTVVAYIGVFSIESFRYRPNYRYLRRQIKTLYMLFIFTVNGIWIALNDLEVTSSHKVFIAFYIWLILVISLYLNVEWNISFKNRSNLSYRSPIHISYPLFITGIVISTIGYILFELASIGGRNNIYWIIHSLWHILSSLGLFTTIYSITDKY